METEERARWLPLFAASLPDHVAATFLAEAAAHPGQWPKLSRDTQATYPDTVNWAARYRTYDPGILYWQWEDGTGFPPPKEHADGSHE